MEPAVTHAHLVAEPAVPRAHLVTAVPGMLKESAGWGLWSPGAAVEAQEANSCRSGPVRMAPHAQPGQLLAHPVGATAETST